MRNLRLPFDFSFLSLSWGAVGTLAVVYIGLIAVVMSYAALTIEFAQSVKTDESAVATLEAEYLASVAQVTNTDYLAEGYAKPVSPIFVRATGATALR